MQIFLRDAVNNKFMTTLTFSESSSLEKKMNVKLTNARQETPPLLRAKKRTARLSAHP